MLETLQLKCSLRKSILEYKKKNPQVSLRSIAKKSGVNRYFISKILDEQDDSASLDLNQVLILAKYISGRESLTEAINETSFEINNVLSKVFALDYESDKVIAHNIYDQVDLRDRSIYFVLVLCSYHLGIKETTISKILGENGELALKELLAKKIVVEEKGRIKLVRGNDFTIDYKLLAERIPDYLNFYRKDRAEKRENFFHLISQGVNKKALREIQKVHLNSFKQINN